MNSEYERLEFEYERLEKAIRTHDVEAFEELLAKGTHLIKTEVYNPISLAINKGHYDMAKKLILAGAPINPDAVGIEEPLAVAVRSNKPNKEIIELLIKHGANVNWQFENEYSIISMACDFSKNYRCAPAESAEIIKLLLDAGAKLDTEYGESSDSEATIVYARESNNKEIYDLIYNNLKNNPDKYGVEYLKEDIFTGNIESIEKYLSKGEDPNATITVFKRGPHPYDYGEYNKKIPLLEYALKRQETKIAHLLINSGAEIKDNYWQLTTDKHLLSILAATPQKQTEELLATDNIKSLLKSWKDTYPRLTKTQKFDTLAQAEEKIYTALESQTITENITDDIHSYLKTQLQKKEPDMKRITAIAIKFNDKKLLYSIVYKAALNNDKETVEKIINFAPELLNKTNTKHHTSMSILANAAQNGHTELVSFLLEKGVKDYNFDLALTKAAQHGHKNTVKVLLEAGATPSKKLLEQAKRSRKPGIYYILNKIIKENEKKLFSRLETAVRENNHEKCTKLLDYHLDFFTSKLLVAAQRNDLETLKILIASGIPLDNTRKRNYARSSLTAIEIAAQNGHLEAVKLLSRAGAAIPSKLPFQAAENGHFKTAMFLFNKSKEQRKQANKTQKSATSNTIAIDHNKNSR